jgi:hypothetical protein
VTVSDRVTIFTIGGILTIPTISFHALSRDMTVMGMVGMSTFTALARDMTVDPTPEALVFITPARDMTVTGSVGISTFTVPAREMSVAA